MMRKTRMEVTECKNSFAIRIYCIKKRSHKKPKKQLSRCGGKIEENLKREIKRRIKAPLKRKRLTPPGEKMMRKTRTEVTECKNSFAIRIYCIKNRKEISIMKNNKN